MPRSHYLSFQTRGTLALPADLRKRHKLDEPGAQVLVVERDDGVVELHPQVAVAADQQWFWTDRWQAMEAEVDAHVDAGHVTTHDDAGSFLASLEE